MCTLLDLDELASCDEALTSLKINKIEGYNEGGNEFHSKESCLGIS